MLKSVIISTGSYLPKKIVTNDDLSKIVETSDEWISSRTGIKQRHISEEKETTSYMAAEAAKKAISKSGLTSRDIDLIIVATTTPDSTFPATACKVQDAIGAKNAAAFDLQAVCSGFLYGLSVADSMIKGGSFKNILIIGADKMSSVIDWKDRSTCVLFGDGAGAFIISSTDKDSSESGIISSRIQADGSLGKILCTSGGTGTTQTAGHIQMEGREVFKHAVQKMTSSMEDLLKTHNLTHADIDWIVPHQANIRIIELIAKKMNLPQDKIIAAIDKHANTSAASIPLAIDTAEAKFKKGDKILLTAAGGGFTWGSVLLVW
jgi:3-oxoacyl-[acyl-carrier-protein] synthase-3